MNRRQFYIYTAVLVMILLCFSIFNYMQDQHRKRIQSGEGGGAYHVYHVVDEDLVNDLVATEPTPDEEIATVNVISAEWGTDDIEGFNYYDIPEEFKKAGGCLPEELQAYIYCICKSYGVDYPTVIALIERESKYRGDIAGDGGASKGYMQVMEKWHISRMDRLDVTDLYNPYSNILTGIDFLAEILEKYPDYDKALMVYNMGENVASNLWSTGVTKSEYSTGIIKRAQDIAQDIQD